MKRSYVYGGVILGVLVLGAASYGFYSYKRTIRNLKTADASMAAELAAQTASYDADISDLKSQVATLESSATSLSTQLTAAQQASSAVAAQVGAVSSTVGTLQKLSQMDPELLKQYSKVYFLNEHYVPISLTTIDPSYDGTPGKSLQFLTSAYPFLQNLITSANATGLSLHVDSAYRSFGTQAVLKQSYRVTYGAGTANSFSAEQGYSEHQLGTAVDFTTPSIGGGLAGFDGTPEYAWLTANAYKYGFVISYPKDNPSYEYEPWHWRFVGIALATYLHNQNEYFYTADQRVIDTYLAGMFDPG